MHGDSFIETQKYPMKPSSTSSCKRSIGNMALTSLLISELSKSPCVTISISEGVGRCADYALEDFDNCLSVYVHAPFEDRINRIENEYGIVKEKSKEVLMKKDKQRSSYYNYYSSNKWGDAKSYDLCLNSSFLGIDGSVEMIKKVITMKESQK